MTLAFSIPPTLSFLYSSPWLFSFSPLSPFSPTFSPPPPFYTCLSHHKYQEERDVLSVSVVLWKAPCTTILNAGIQVLTLPLTSIAFLFQAPNCSWTCQLIFKWGIGPGKFFYVFDPLVWTIWGNCWKLKDERLIVDGIGALIWVR